MASQPHPGSHLGPYQLLELLGEGGMGRVYKARHRWLKRVVALKVIREEIVADADAIRRFRREVEAAGRLSHPNIILALDADAADGKHFLVMEYVDGLDLSRAVRERGPLPVPVACDCIRQAALGLRHVHEHALVHRDIKPANLLMTQGSVVKVADLGLARLHESGRSTRTLTQEGSLIGTPDYLAPEQAATPHRADIRADIYSLGCTFYYLLAGRPPFPGGSYLQKLVRHQECEPEPIERHRADVPPAVCRIVRKMMAKRPEDRYQAPDQVVEAVGSYCYDAGPDRERQDEPGSGPPDILLERGEPTSSRASSRRGSGALIRVVGPWIVCLGGSMVAGLLLLSGPERTPAPSGPGIRRNRPIPNQGASLPTPEYSSGFLPRDRSGDRFPPPRGRAGSSRMGEGAQDRAVAADLPRTFADGRHSRFTGRAGPREFAGTGLAKDRAPLQTDVLTVTLKAASLDFLLVSLGSPSMRTPPLFAVGLTLAALSNSGARAQEKDATADVRKMVEKEQYYKLSGPAGPRYFVVGTDVALVHARLQGDALTITLKVEKGHRGIGLLNLDGLAELEFTPHGGKADLIKVRDDDQKVNFDRPGILTVRIRDVKSLKEPIKSKD